MYYIFTLRAAPSLSTDTEKWQSKKENKEKIIRCNTYRRLCKFSTFNNHNHVHNLHKFIMLF